MSGKRKQWRSLEGLADDPRAAEFMQREFPEGASEAPEGIDRRSMITLLGASLSLAGFAGCRRPVEEIVPYVTAPEHVIPGVPRHYATTMPFGLDAYGLVVESHEGRPTKIEGNDLHPSTKGSSNAWVQASILDLYDPDRAQHVTHGGEKRSWDDFVAAWTALDETHRADGGARLAVLTAPHNSPTLSRLSQAFASRFPAARTVAWAPLADENVLAGVRQATGESLVPALHVDRAKVILALDSDFLHTDSQNITSARGFADGRRLVDGNDSMNRLYVAEGVHSLTGGNADHRVRVRSSRIPALVAALASELRAQGLSLDGAGGHVDGVDAGWLHAVAGDLMQHRGHGLIVAGPRQPAEVHAAVLALNAALGNVGTTVEYRPLTDAAPSDSERLATLAADLEAGSIDTLVIVGGNPAYDAPAELDLAARIAQADTVIRLGCDLDETSALAQWQIPGTHYLEAWGDARAADGTASVIQPLILPLYGGKSEVELLNLLASGADAPGHDAVRETWNLALGRSEFDKRWNKVLHDGLLAESAQQAAQVSLGSGARDALGKLSAGAAQAQEMELVFTTGSPYDGRFANNGWLQELPDAMTKMTWDNAAMLSPADAATLGVANGDEVRVSHGGAEIALPAWIVPGQADGVVAVALGYGRETGRIAGGTGANAYALRSGSAAGFVAGVAIEATGAARTVAQTQDHHGMEDRPLVRNSSLEDYRQHPEFAKHMVEHPPGKAMWEEHSYDSGNQWGMSIDLNACTGCGACVIACQSENNIPVVGPDQVHRGREMHWLRIDRYFEGEPEDAQVLVQPVPCMHCENAPCEQVCPVAATVHDEEGLNAMVYNRCIGTRYCSNNCPYKVRRFNFYNFTKDTPESVQLAHNPDVTVRSRGVMEKCTYCTQRIQAAKITAKLEERPLRDGEIRTACQQACPARAITFGDILDDNSEVARRKAEPRDYGLLEELYTKPRTTYMAKLRNPHPDLADDSHADPADH
ncbi:MAG: TAT-variant-translocated molybdopterin oxidoreductase [bacterium]|nr:TAT-variant-translocated molybdopterin oxidoreductase [bacterium]